MGISQTEDGKFPSPIEGIVHRGLVYSVAERGSVWLGHGIRGVRVQEEVPGEGRSHSKESELFFAGGHWDPLKERSDTGQGPGLIIPCSKRPFEDRSSVFMCVESICHQHAD